MFKVKEKLKLTNTNELPDQEVEVEIVLAESLAEAVQDAGGEEQLKDIYNDSKKNRAKTAGRNVYRNLAAGSDVAQGIEKAIKAVVEFAFGNERGMGVKKKAEKFDQLAALLSGEGGELPTREQLLAILGAK